MGLPSLLDSTLPKPGSAIGFSPSSFILPALLSLHGGGSTLEDIRMIACDQALRDLLTISQIPSADSYGKWLLRHGRNPQYLRAFGKVVTHLLCRSLHLASRRDYTLDIDAFQIVAEKQTAKRTYKGNLAICRLLAILLKTA